MSFLFSTREEERRRKNRTEKKFCYVHHDAYYLAGYIITSRNLSLIVQMESTN
jgi:hypothetical protein